MIRGPILAAPPCPGRHGLWQALAGAETGADADAAFAELPPDLRALLGPPLVTRLLGRGKIAEARRTQDLILRSGIAASPELTYTEALLAIGEGRRAAARIPLGVIAASQLPEAPEALLIFARLSLDQNAVPSDLAVDLETAARTYRGTPVELPLRALGAEALAETGALAEALASLGRARADLPLGTDRFEALAARLLAAADPATVGPSTYAKLALDAPRILANDRATDPDRAEIAAKLLGLGLPKVARDIVAPGIIRDDSTARLIGAEAELRLGAPRAAIALTDGMDGPAIAQFRARALAGDGAYADAVETLDKAGLDVEAGPYAWAAGDWRRVGVAENPRRRAMAAFMAGTGPEAGAPAADAAFATPLPPLNRPSLAATRQLLEHGPKIEGFVREIIAPTP